MVALLYWIAKLELETIKVEIADFPFFSHQLIVGYMYYNFLNFFQVKNEEIVTDGSSVPIASISWPLQTVWSSMSSKTTASLNITNAPIAFIGTLQNGQF